MKSIYPKFKFAFSSGSKGNDKTLHGLAEIGRE
jgi:hypothetical protein